MGVIKNSGTAEQKSALAVALKRVKSEAMPAAPATNDALLRAQRELEVARAHPSLKHSAVGIFRSARARSHQVEAAEAFDAQAALVERGRETVVAVGEQVLQWWGGSDAMQLEVAEQSLKAVVAVVKQQGSAEQKTMLADELKKGVPQAFPEASADVERVTEWRKRCGATKTASKPNPLPLMDALDSLRETSEHTMDPALTSGDLPSLVATGVSFSEAFDAGEDTPAPAAAAVAPLDSNVCPTCKGDFFDANELRMHLRAGCRLPPPDEPVHTAPKASPRELELADDAAEPKTPLSVASRFIHTTTQKMRRLSRNSVASSGGSSPSISIGAPTDLQHEATADAKGHVVRVIPAGSAGHTHESGTSVSPRSAAAPMISITPAVSATPSPSLQRRSTMDDSAPSTPSQGRRPVPPVPSTPTTPAVARGPALSGGVVGAGSVVSSPAVPRRPAEVAGAAASPMPPRMSAVSSAAPAASPMVSRGPVTTAGTASPMLSRGSSSGNALALSSLQATETVLEVLQLRVEVGPNDLLAGRLKTPNVRAHIKCKVGTHMRATTSMEGALPGTVDFAGESGLVLPYNFQGLPFSIHVVAKGFEPKKGSTATKIDFANLGRPTVSEHVHGATKEIPVGSLPTGQMLTYPVYAVGADAPQQPLCSVTFLAQPTEQEPLALAARRCVAPRQLPQDIEAIKSVESAKLLLKKIADFRSADPPSRWKQRPSTGVPALDAAEAWPPRLKEVCQHIRKGYRPTEAWHNWRGQTLLHLAAMAGDVVAVRAAMRFGIEDEALPERISVDDAIPVRKPKKPFYTMSTRDDESLTPWMCAVLGGHLEVLMEMVSFDSDAANGTLYSLDAMHVAAAANLSEVMVYLFGELHKSLDVKDQNSATPLFYAAFAGHYEMVEYLCNNRCFVDVEDAQSQSPILMALEGGHAKIAKLLLSHKADLNAFNLRGDNALWLCILHNHQDLLADLVTSGRCDLNHALERHRNTLMHKIVLFVDDESQACMMLAALLGHGGRVECLNMEKKTPLHLACALSRQKVTTLLLNSGANAKARDVFENTPLHFAFLPSICEALVSKGASVDARNLDDNTAMHVMSAFGMLETVSWCVVVGFGWWWREVTRAVFIVAASALWVARNFATRTAILPLTFSTWCLPKAGTYACRFSPRTHRLRPREAWCCWTNRVRRMPPRWPVPRTRLATRCTRWRKRSRQLAKSCQIR